ncbi:MAG: WG repeat-containing protein [Saprospiraceae bacterium]
MMKQPFLFLLYLFLFSTMSAQDVEMPKSLPEDPKEIPPLDHLNYIDTLRSGLYRASFGKNMGYHTPGHTYGFFNDEEMIIPFRYCQLSRDYSNFMIAKKYIYGVGAIDSLNRTVIPFIYTAIDHVDRTIPDYKNKYFKAYLGKKVGLINQKGEVLIPIEYAKVTVLELSKGIFSIKDQQGKTGLVNLDAKVFTDCIYTDGIGRMTESFYKTGNKELNSENRLNRTYGCVSPEGKVLAPPIFKSITLSTDKKHLIAYDYDHLQSKIYNEAGQVVFQKDSVEIKNLVLGNYFFFKNRTSYLIRNNFKEVVPMAGYPETFSPRYYRLSSTVSVGTSLKKKQSFGVYNFRNEEVLAPKFAKIVFANDDLFFARTLTGKPLYRAYDGKGNALTEPLYTFVEASRGEKFAIVAHAASAKFAVVDSIGNLLTDFDYDNLYFSPIKLGQSIFQIVGFKGEKKMRILPDGSVTDVKGFIMSNKTKLYYVKSDQKATLAFVGKHEERIVLAEQDTMKVQYQFVGEGKGQRSIFYKDKKEKEQSITQNLHLRISHVNVPGETAWLWIWFEPFVADNIPKKIRQVLTREGISLERADFPMKVPYPYTSPEILNLNE